MRVLKADGVTPVSGVSITFSATGTSVSLGACGASTCTVQTNAAGVASTTATPLAAGTVAYNRDRNPRHRSSIVHRHPPPPQITLISAPSGTIYIGDAAPTAFAVRVLMGDGVTPVAGTPIVFAATGAAVSFAACGAATCTVLTNASGVASTTVIPMSAGIAVLTGTGSAGSQTASFTAVARVRTLTMMTPTYM